MGVIKRQGFKRSIVSYISVGVGVFSTLFIYPLELEIYGVAQFLISLALLLAPVASLGTQSLVVRFYPEFQDEEGNDRGFLRLLSGVSLVSAFLFGVLAYWGLPKLLDFLALIGFNSEIITDNLTVVALLIFLHIFLNLFTHYSSTAKLVVVPEIIRNFGLKLALPILVLLYYYNYLQDVSFTYALVGFFLVAVLLLAAYLYHLGKWSSPIQWSFLTRDRNQRMSVYAFFGILTVLGSALTFRIDSLMVTTLIDAKSNGVYNIGLFITNTILIPYYAIMAIASPILSEKWAVNDLDGIQDIYRRSSLNLVLIGCFLLALIYLLLDDILRISVNFEELKMVKTTVLLLGLAKLVDMTTGLNGQIIAYSKYYRFNLYVILLLAALNLGLNYWLIPEHGIEGAAWATLISLSLYNVAKFVFLLIQYNMQPFTWASLLILGICSAAYVICTFIPATAWPLVNLILLGGCFSLLFWFPTLYWRLSPDINSFLLDAWQKITNRDFF